MVAAKKNPHIIHASILIVSFGNVRLSSWYFLIQKDSMINIHLAVSDILIQIPVINIGTMIFFIIFMIKWFKVPLITLAHNDLLNAVLLCEGKDNKYKQQ